MKAERFSQALGAVRDSYIEEALKYKKKKTIGFKMGSWQKESPWQPVWSFCWPSAGC